MQYVLNIERILKKLSCIKKIYYRLGDNNHLIKYTVLLLPKAFEVVKGKRIFPRAMITTFLGSISYKGSFCKNFHSAINLNSSEKAISNSVKKSWLYNMPL